MKAQRGPFGRMWDRLTCRFVDVVERVDHRGARSSRPAGDPSVEVVTENPYHETRQRISAAPGELRKRARGMRSGARILNRVHEDAKEQHASDVAKDHRAVRLDAGRMMMRTAGESKDATDGAVALDKHVQDAQEFRRDAGKRFRAKDRRFRAWAKGAEVDENPTAS